MKTCIIFFLGGIAATIAMCAAAQNPKTRELWEKGLDKGKQAKQKAMDTLQRMKDEAAEKGSELKDKLAEKLHGAAEHTEKA